MQVQVQVQVLGLELGLQRVLVVEAALYCNTKLSRLIKSKKNWATGHNWVEKVMYLWRRRRLYSTVIEIVVCFCNWRNFRSGVCGFGRSC